jgi:hypothetical protein
MANKISVLEGAKLMMRCAGPDRMTSRPSPSPKTSGWFSGGSVGVETSTDAVEVGAGADAGGIVGAQAADKMSNDTIKLCGYDFLLNGSISIPSCLSPG